MTDAISIGAPVIDLTILLNCKNVDDVQNLSDTNSKEYQSLIKAFRDAATEWGFFYVINHGVSHDFIKAYQSSMQEFFKLPKEKKLKIKRTDSNSRGYFDDELTKNKTDWKEAVDIGGKWENEIPDKSDITRMLNDQNQWLEESILPGFQANTMKYYDIMEQLADKLLMIFALVLGQKASYFRSFYYDKQGKPTHSSFLRLNYYPISPNPANAMAVHHHTDAGALTILLQDDTITSLQVYHRKSESWCFIPPRQDTFVINIGDLLQVWSNDKFIAPVHQVLANEQSERSSIPFFYNPSYESTILPIAPENEQSYHPLPWLDFRLSRFQGDYADAGEEVQIQKYKKFEFN